MIVPTLVLEIVILVYVEINAMTAALVLALTMKPVVLVVKTNVKVVVMFLIVTRLVEMFVVTLAVVIV